MKPRKLEPQEESEIARRLRLRHEYATKQLMIEFRCSRSLIDRIARQVNASILLASNQRED